MQSNLCRSLELSQASEAQPENLLPSVIGSAVTQMLQDPALCLPEREFCPWGGWEGAATQPPAFTCTSDTHTQPLLSSSSSCATSRAPSPTQLMCWKGVTSVGEDKFQTNMEVFSIGQKTSRVSPSLPPDTSQSCQPGSHIAVCVLKSDANLPPLQEYLTDMSLCSFPGVIAI